MKAKFINFKILKIKLYAVSFSLSHTVILLLFFQFGISIIKIILQKAVFGFYILYTLILMLLQYFLIY